MQKELSASEIEARFAEIDSREPDRLTQEEERSLAEAEAMDDGTTVPLDAFIAELEGYNGKISLRIPRSLHKTLKDQSIAEGVSLNQYLLYKLSK